MSIAPVKKKRVTLIKSPGQQQPIMNQNKKYNIEHPMYERLASQYTTDYIVTDAIKASLEERPKTLNLLPYDMENMFLLIMTHFNKNPVKNSFSFMSTDLPYGGKQLKTKNTVNFEIENMPDQIIFILHKFLDIIEEQLEDQVKPMDDVDQGDYGEQEYTESNLGYAVIG